MMRVPILLHGREHSGLATEAWKKRIKSEICTVAHTEKHYILNGHTQPFVPFVVVLFPGLEMRLVFGFAVGLTRGFTFGFAVVLVGFG